VVSFVQVYGIEDIYVFDGGLVNLDTNGSIGSDVKGHTSLKSLYVQADGTFQMSAFNISNTFTSNITNVTVGREKIDHCMRQIHNK